MQALTKRDKATAGERQRVVVDLGCGSRKKAGAIGLDIARIPEVDMLVDVMRTLPFRDSSIDEIHASHLVEHVDDLLAFVGEVWRVCKPGALVYFRFPHASSAYVTWKDPTHRRGVLLDTFKYFDPKSFEGTYFGYYHPAKFDIRRQRLTFNMNTDTFVPRRGRRIAGRIIDALANRNERAQYFCERFWAPLVGIEEAHVWMRAIK
jgi:SAM-dependent methyltransferase